MALSHAGSNGSLSGSASVVDHPAPAVNGVSPVDPTTLRVRQIQEALANLAEQVATQAEHQVMLERRLDDMGKVLGGFGVEVSDRLDRLERER